MNDRQLAQWLRRGLNLIVVLAVVLQSAMSAYQPARTQAP